jgi:type VI secretion system (T6SS) effector TldE1-like protein
VDDWEGGGVSYTYCQGTGVLTHNGAFAGVGYSGHGKGLNDPGEQGVEGVGPIPQGRYTIGPPKDPIDHLGPLAMPLTPDPANEMFGRSAFFMHGDNAAANHTASDGCIIMGREVRQAVAESGDHELTVIV